MSSFFSLTTHLYGEQGQGPDRTHLHSTRPGWIQAHLEDGKTLFLRDVSEDNYEDVRDDADVDFFVGIPERFRALVRY